MGVNKENEKFKSLCADCIHKDAKGNEHPCMYCWNPIGDMYEPRANAEPYEYSRFIKEVMALQKLADESAALRAAVKLGVDWSEL